MIPKFLIAALATAAAVPLLAQVAPIAPAAPVVSIAPVTPMLARVMTRAEIQAKVQAHFAKLDSNHDGFIAGDELQRKHPGGAWQGENSRKMVMRDGPMGDPNALFDKLDANKDGMISRDEFAKGRELRIEKRIVTNGEGAPMGERMHVKGGGMRGMHMMGGGMIKMADLNKDGRVSLPEATTTALQHFDRADTNHDGRLTPDEMRAGHRTMIEMRKPG